MTRLNIILIFLFTLSTQSALPLSANGTSLPIKVIDSLTIFRNLRYAPQPDSLNGDTSSDKNLDVYIPAGFKNKRLPVLIFVHGGGFAAGDKKSTSVECSKIAEKGFAVISINYWLTLKHQKFPGPGSNYSKGIPPGKRFPPGKEMAIQNASADLVLVLKWVKKYAKRYNLDISKVALSGGSAGGMTVLYTAYASGQDVLPVKAVVNLWGALADVTVVKPGAPPVLTYHGDQDKLINVDLSYALKEQMDKIGDKRSILHIMDGKGHARYDIIREDKIEEIVDFLNKTMK